MIFGLSMGFILPSNLSDNVDHRKTIEYVSGIIGWTYFMAWSISFYPQLYTNWQRQSVVGLSLDFELYNLIGFAFYSIFNVSFFYSSSVDEQYKHFHNGKSNAVQANDVVFALHAVLITAITCVQCVVYERGDQKLSKPCIYFAIFSITSSALYIVLIATNVSSNSIFTTLNWLYYLSYVKLVISISKYIPQVYMNYSRKSTYGWNIYNVLLDFTGGSLSVLQLCLDAGLQDDWSGVTGDPVKFGLGFASMVFDVIFVVQHYVLYPREKSVSRQDASYGSTDDKADALLA